MSFSSKYFTYCLDIFSCFSFYEDMAVCSCAYAYLFERLWCKEVGVEPFLTV